MEAAISIIVLAVIGLGLYVHAKQKARRQVALDAISAFLGGASDADRRGARGAVDGLAVSIRYETRGSGKNSSAWTYLDAVLPGGYPLVLRLRPHGWSDAGKIARGEMVDVVFGDAPFDAAFRVEGAPAEVIRGMIDAPARALLCHHVQIELDTREGGTLGLSIAGWLEDPAIATPALACLARMARSVRDATAAADQAIQAAQIDSPYRPALDGQPLVDAQAARAAEVQALDSRLKQRATAQAVIAGVVLVLVVVVLVSIAGK